MIDIRSGIQAKQLKDALAQINDNDKIDIVANDMNILNAVKKLCSKAGIDIVKFGRDIDNCVNDIAYSVYVGKYKIAQH